MTQKRAARRPAPRTVTIALEGDFEGWTATARADFPARVLTELQSGDLDRVFTALQSIILDHNFPDMDGNVATTVHDVDPVDGITKFLVAYWDAVGKLPNR